MSHEWVYFRDLRLRRFIGEMGVTFSAAAQYNDFDVLVCRSRENCSYRTPGLNCARQIRVITKRVR
jgi:hypothetical protein